MLDCWRVPGGMASHQFSLRQRGGTRAPGDLVASSRSSWIVGLKEQYNAFRRVEDESRIFSTLLRLPLYTARSDEGHNFVTTHPSLDLLPRT